MYNDYLYHYGVLGMKWGVRKDRGARHTGNGNRKKKGAIDKVKKSYSKLSPKTKKRIRQAAKLAAIGGVAAFAYYKSPYVRTSVNRVVKKAGDRAFDAIVAGAMVYAGREFAKWFFEDDNVGKDIFIQKKK